MLKLFLRKRNLFPALLMFTFCLPAVSQIKVSSIQIFSTNKIPLQDAFIYNLDYSFTASSNENGYVDLKGMPANTSNLSISRIGYTPKTISLYASDVTGTILSVFLDEQISRLQNVTIRAATNGGIFKTISDLDIHLRPINNSQEVLRIVPGLFIGQHAGGGKAEQIFLRGFDLDHGTDINLTVDGMPVNMVSHAHGQGYADLHFVIPELIDKVTFNKGPYYADKGNFTTAGFVDFKTKNYLENNFVKVEGGQFNTFRSIAGINLLKPKDKKTQSLYVAGEASFTKGYFDDPQNFSRYNGLLKYHGSVSERSTLTAMLTAFTSRWNASGQIPERAVENGTVGFYGAIDNTEGGETSRYNANAELLTNLRSGGVLRNNIFYSRYKFKLYSNFTFYKEDPINGDQIRQGESRSIIGYNSSYQKDFFIGKIKAQTKTGLQIRYDIIDNIELSRTKNRNFITQAIQSGNVDELNAGAFIAQKFMVHKNLDITGAIRTDYFTNSYDDKLANKTLFSNSTIISPKLNLDYRLNEQVHLYWYNGRGFHSNDTRVAVVENGKKVVPPAWGSDVGGIFKIGRRTVLQTAAWYLFLQQEFVYVGDEGVVEPSGRTQRIGLDASLRYEVLENLYADIDVSIAKPKAVDEIRGQNFLPLAPIFTSVGGLTYRKQSGFNGSFRYRYMANRPANEDNSVIAKGYFISDASINYTQKNWEAGLTVQNLFNSKWKETQFDTESRLQAEPAPVSEIHFTPGTPFFARLSFAVFF